MEDLVSRRPAAPAGDAAKDPRRVEGAEHRLEPLGVHPRVPSEIVDGVGDLAPGRRHEMVEEPRGEVALLVVQAGERALEMLLDDLLCAAELVQRRSTQHVRAPLALDLPEALEHQLEIRRLDSSRPLAIVHEAPAGDALLDPAGGDLVEHRLDQLVLGRDACATELGVRAQAALRSPSVPPRVSGDRGGEGSRTAPGGGA